MTASNLRASTLTPLSQKDRILRLARARGAHGICATDFLHPGVVDGGGQITRVPARIGELEEEGFTFDRPGKRSGFQVYVLTGATQHGVPADSPSSPTTAAAETPTASGSAESSGTPAPLFELPAHVRPAGSIYQDDAA